MNFPFRTLNRPVSVTGVTLHSGQQVTATLCPDERQGIRFQRLDLEGQSEVEANFASITTTTHATTLANGEATVSTTEHLIAALWALGITHCRVELNGPEVPILDGSAQGWVKLIEQAGQQSLDKARPVMRLNSPVWFQSGATSVVGVPHDQFRLTVAVDFAYPGAGEQTFDGIVSPETFTDQIAAARTFTLEPWIEPLRAANLIRGGSLENAVVVSPTGYSSPLRFPNELARHKGLDVVGDLALLFGSSVFQGHIIAVRAGHEAHRKWMEQVMSNSAINVA